MSLKFGQLRREEKKYLMRLLEWSSAAEKVASADQSHSAEARDLMLEFAVAFLVVMNLSGAAIPMVVAMLQVVLDSETSSAAVSAVSAVLANEDLALAIL